jgi:hypothetical protein
VLTLTGCGFSQGVGDGAKATVESPSAGVASAKGLTATQIVEQLGTLYPTPNPTDNTGACAARADSTSAGCVQLVTTDSVSVYQWPDESTARRFCPSFGKCDVVGAYVLSYTARKQARTTVKARQAYAAKAREMLRAG